MQRRWRRGTLAAVGLAVVLVAAAPQPLGAAPPRDTQPPGLTLPGDITVPNDPGYGGAAVRYSAPQATDNNPGAYATCSPTSGTFFRLGRNQVSCAAVDAAGNTTRGSFQVTVNDVDPPSVDVPGPVTVAAGRDQSGAVVWYDLPFVRDNSTSAVFSCAPVSGSFFPIGRNTVRCNALDGAGNQSSTGFSVTVTDGQAPTITHPGDVRATAPPGASSTVVTFPLPSGRDNAGVVSVSCTPASGSRFAGEHQPEHVRRRPSRCHDTRRGRGQTAHLGQPAHQAVLHEGGRWRLVVGVHRLVGHPDGDLGGRGGDERGAVQVRDRRGIRRTHAVGEHDATHLVDDIGEGDAGGGQRIERLDGGGQLVAVDARPCTLAGPAVDLGRDGGDGPGQGGVGLVVGAEEHGRERRSPRQTPVLSCISIGKPIGMQDKTGRGSGGPLT